MENRGTPDYRQMNGYMVYIKTIYFWKEESPIFSKMHSFPWVLLAHPSSEVGTPLFSQNFPVR